jgi:hypothetical protein
MSEIEDDGDEDVLNFTEAKSTIQFSRDRLTIESLTRCKELSGSRIMHAVCSVIDQFRIEGDTARQI